MNNGNKIHNVLGESSRQEAYWTAGGEWKGPQTFIAIVERCIFEVGKYFAIGGACTYPNPFASSYVVFPFFQQASDILGL